MQTSLVTCMSGKVQEVRVAPWSKQSLTGDPVDGDKVSWEESKKNDVGVRNTGNSMHHGPGGEVWLVKVKGPRSLVGSFSNPR